MEPGASPSAASSSAAFRWLCVLVESVRAGTPTDLSDTTLLDALTQLRALRTELDGWEPELVRAARDAGVSWSALAPALGVASRQAAERRYLRTRPTGAAEMTKEARVDATRDRRAGDRAVTAWAKRNSATLRQLAGQVSGLPDLTDAGRRDAELVQAELAGDDTASLLGPLAAMRSHLTERHPDLANRISTLAGAADRQRHDAVNQRRTATSKTG
jgi:hypothetical protein